jgi:hypothetical protein
MCKFHAVILANDQVNAQMMMTYVCRKLAYKFMLRDVIGPLKRELDLLSGLINNKHYYLTKKLLKLEEKNVRAKNKYYKKYNIKQRAELSYTLSRFKTLFSKTYKYSKFADIGKHGKYLNYLDLEKLKKALNFDKKYLNIKKNNKLPGYISYNKDYRIHNNPFKRFQDQSLFGNLVGLADEHEPIKLPSYYYKRKLQ